MTGVCRDDCRYAPGQTFHRCQICSSFTAVGQYCHICFPDNLSYQMIRSDIYCPIPGNPIRKRLSVVTWGNPTTFHQQCLGMPLLEPLEGRDRDILALIVQ